MPDEFKLSEISAATAIAGSDLVEIAQDQGDGSYISKKVTGANALPIVFQLACSDTTTALTTGTNKAYFRVPFAVTVTAVRASVLTAPTGGTLLTIDINDGGVSILSTKLTFDASAKTTKTATTPAIISDTSLADDAEIGIDIDAVGSTVAGAGLVVTIIGYRT